MEAIHRNIIIGLTICMISFLGISPAMSANLIATPRILLEERWDSNIRNTSTDEISDYIFRASPRLTLAVETPLAKVSLTGGLDYERYAEHEEFNGKAATYFNLNTEKPLRFTPRFSVLPTVRYVEANDPVRRNVLTQSPIPGLPPSETIVTVPTKSREFSGYLQLTYLLTPNVDLGLGGGGSKREFLDNDPATLDATTVSAGASVSYRFTPRFSSGFVFDASRNTFENDTDSDTYDAGISMRYLLSEHFTVDGRVGVDHLKETTATGDDTNTSPSGRLSLIYDWRDFKAVLLGSYGLAGGGSFGVTTHRGNIQLSLSDRFSPSWWWNLTGSYQINRSLDTPRTEDISAWYGNAGLHFRAAEWVLFHLSGDFVRQTARNSIVGADLDRSAVILGVDLNKDYKLF